ncbi:MAG: energy transducer TonB [Fusobacteriota bacterium]
MLGKEDKIYIYAIIVSFIVHIILINILPGLRSLEIDSKEEEIKSVKTRFIKLKKNSTSDSEVKRDTQKSKIETEESGDKLEQEESQVVSGETEEVEFTDTMPEVDLSAQNVIRRENTRDIILTKEDDTTFKKGQEEVDFKNSDLKFDSNKNLDEEVENIEDKIPVKIEEDFENGEIAINVDDIENVGSITDVEMPDGIKKIEVEGKGRITSFVGRNPEYPDLARKRGWEGQVHLEFIVTENSEVERVNIKKKSGYDILDIEAKKEISNWQLQIVNNGMQIRGKVNVIIDFRLESKN